MSRKQTRSPLRRSPARRNQRAHVPDGYLAVGVIVSVHGLRGEVKVEPHTDFPERFQPGMQLRLGDDLIIVHVERARQHKRHILLQFEELQTREEAEELRNHWLFVSEQDAFALDDDTFWVHDIIGLRVQTTDAEPLGTITDVLFTGANEVYVVQPAGSLNKGKDILLPAIGDVVQQVDLDAGVLTVALPPGLLEE